MGVHPFRLEEYMEKVTLKIQQRWVAGMKSTSGSR